MNRDSFKIPPDEGFPAAENQNCSFTNALDTSVYWCKGAVPRSREDGEAAAAQLCSLPSLYSLKADPQPLEWARILPGDARIPVEMLFGGGKEVQELSYVPQMCPGRFSNTSFSL